MPRGPAIGPAQEGARNVRVEKVEALFQEHADGLFAFLAYRTGDRGLAEDLVAETFERVLRHRKKFSPGRNTEKGWLYTIALNLARDHARRAKVEHRALEQAAAQSAGQSADSGPRTVEDRDELHRALRVLSDAELEAITLRFGADLKLRDIAQVLGEGESAVEGRIYRGLAKLRDQLQ
jgi:RNA polymerase sigma-70 factor (ECF subfamily)